MKRLLFLLPALLLALGSAQGALPSPYGIARPTIPIVEGDHGVTVAPIQGGVVLPSDVQPQGAAEVKDPVYGLSQAAYAFPIDRSSAQYYLGDRLPPPDDDAAWSLTDALLNDPERLNEEYIIDEETGNVYAIVGGTIKLEWTKTAADGSSATQDVSYQVSPVASGRPMRVYWTNEPYNGPTVDFTGEFVQLYGIDAPITKSDTVSQTESIVHGIYVENGLLHVIQGDMSNGVLSGQFVVAYYDSGLYDRLLGLVVVEVATPNPVDLQASVGEALVPYGGGHNTEGLLPFPVTATATDNRGDYFYQHQGVNSYSPKHGNVYPLRPTEALNTRVQVWWKEYDDFGTLWPYELCRYECTWGENAITMVRGPLGNADGLPMTFENTLSVELQPYQDPEGHAEAVDSQNYRFNTRIIEELKPHYSLLKVTGNDNIWFVPVHSVASDDVRYFSGEVASWNIGNELRPRGGSEIATVGAYLPDVDVDESGYIYAPTSGTNYNVNAYYEKDTSVTGQSTAHAYRSAIFPINTDAAKDLEVWWSSQIQDPDMPGAIHYPSLTQKYRAKWPEANEAATIVLASQIGSEQETVYTQGKALYLDKVTAAVNSTQTTTTTVKLPATRYFRKDEGTVCFWFRAPETASGRLLTLASEENAFAITADIVDKGLTVTLSGATLSAPDIADGKWHFVRINFKDKLFTLSINAEQVGNVGYELAGGQTAPLNKSSLGHSAMLSAAVGAEIDAVAIWRTSMVDEALANPTERVQGLMLYLSFDEANDLEPITGQQYRTAYEHVTRVTLTVENGLASQPGSPKLGNGILTSDTFPSIYTQNDPTLPGYNPNEEHAMVTSGESGYVVWALRDDLNTDTSSKPVVLASYTLNGEPMMRAYHVLRTQEGTYPALAGERQAGTLLSGPHPMDFLPDYWNEKNAWTAKTVSPYRDRKLQLWAIAADEATKVKYWYPVQEGFAFPSKSTQPAIGEYVPWLGEEGNQPEWTWTIQWPDSVPEMKIGQTLTTAESGLPEVWAAKSMAVLYPQTTLATAQTSLGTFNDRVRLYDPTVLQTASLEASGCATTTDLIKALNLDISDTGNADYRYGSYTLRGLPPSLSSRFTIDPTRPITEAIGLVGEKEENTASTSLLHLNVLRASERKALKNIFTIEDNLTLANAWQSAIDRLATDIVYPNTYVGGEVQTEISYSPVDHYALTAVGGETGYITLIENDSPDSTIVNEADPISVHILKVIPQLAAAPLAVREDPINLLSQQLSVIYGESFAGKADDFEFEWRKRLPNSNGVIPSDIDNDGYTPLGEPTAGQTDILIGSQGDTLDNMVNTYYAVRYRAKPGTKAYTTMGDTWSAWSGPTLAEGWVQRVLNNITPFTQQMVDLYNNKAETATSMIEKAGAPYVGDVALNQDNLANVGLLQLYLTLLNKAETLSVVNGPTLEAANEQLLLAATRAADLYAVLGDEAYADALNPTIGFGGDFTTEEGLDYGSIATSLFCFDNQVTTLLDEELALLRGRGADYQGVSLRTGPYYNRLPWNFTRGMTEGEVAYAVNYNISGTKSSTVDVEEAAKHFPQGHGDAYGHYLSATKLYYRLLRNPNFSWGTPGMGEMLLGDTVVNVDYYDEQRFAEIAGKMAEVARATFDRTARKAYAENGGEPGAGYVDNDANRAFGYGEWAAKAAHGTFYNWAVANSLLPESPNTLHYQQMILEDGNPTDGLFTSLSEYCLAAHPLDDSTRHFPFTLEFQVSPEAEQTAEHITLMKWLGSAEDGTPGHITLSLTTALELTATTSLSETPVEVMTLTPGERVLVALGRELTGDLHVRVLSSTGDELKRVALPSVPALQGGSLHLGGALIGTLSEIRWWAGEYQDNTTLHTNIATVKEYTDALVHYVRTFTRLTAPNTLTDEVNATPWTIVGASWTSYAEVTGQLPYEDPSLTKINRATASALNTMPDEMTKIYETLERLDAGLNPLGLSDNAVPFDITPIGVADGTASHFEQILSRAEVALKNATAVLDRAQTLGSRLRQIEEAKIAIEDRLNAEELTMEGDLVGYYGTPYSDDIGPGGLYVQGYTGPDYYHYMYMDLEEFGITTDGDLKELIPTEVTYHNYSLTSPDYSNLIAGSFSVTESGDAITLPYTVSADGFVMKPEHFTGSRASVGKLQQAYADALVEYVTYEEALKNIPRYQSKLESSIEEINMLYDCKSGYFMAWETLTAAKYAASDVLKILSLASNKFQTKTEIAMYSADGKRVPWTIAGMAVGTDAGDVIQNNVQALLTYTPRVTSSITSGAYANAKTIVDFVSMAADQVLSLTAHEIDMRGTLNSYRNSLFGSINSYYDAVIAARESGARLTAAIQNFSAIRSEAETLRDQRELLRQQATNALTRLRYNDMFFRQVRNEALARYEKAFEIAQRYVYLAAQAYGYETAASMDALRAEVIGARTIGLVNDAGEPQEVGDGSLADILARMKADWSVVKGRLGINNPQADVTWFSLRNELLRIPDSAEKDADWQTALQGYIVEDLRQDPRYRRYCQPLFSGDDKPEPALVIPFSTTMEFAKNFFGHDLAGGDSKFSGGYYATRIAGAGVRFKGYNPKASGSVLASTPSVWLVPVGADYLRVPGGTKASDVVKAAVVDQVVPLPYNVGNTQLNDSDWQPLYDGDMGGADRAIRIRRHPSFRVTYGDTLPDYNEEVTTGGTLRASRLIGRSVWNDQWVLIIPFGEMNNDREAAKEAFIKGTESNKGISDILLGLRTYSHSGN